MDPRALIVNLETSYVEYNPASASARDVVLAGLRWPTPYWPNLAVAWLEQGAPIDQEVVVALDEVAAKKYFPQQLRHKAFAIARRWSPQH